MRIIICVRHLRFACARAREDETHAYGIRCLGRRMPTCTIYVYRNHGRQSSWRIASAFVCALLEIMECDTWLLLAAEMSKSAFTIYMQIAHTSVYTCSYYTLYTCGALPDTTRYTRHMTLGLTNKCEDFAAVTRNQTYTQSCSYAKNSNAFRTRLAHRL